MTGTRQFISSGHMTSENGEVREVTVYKVGGCYPYRADVKFGNKITTRRSMELVGLITTLMKDYGNLLFDD